MMYDEKGRLRNGSPRFYRLLEEMAETHDKKSHDYASNSNPSGNYHFAGQMASMFMHSPEDAGFFGRIAEKVYRLANLESEGKRAKNESIEDTERDIAVITCLWMADRHERRARRNPISIEYIDRSGIRKVPDENPASERGTFDVGELYPGPPNALGCDEKGVKIKPDKIAASLEIIELLHHTMALNNRILELLR